MGIDAELIADLFGLGQPLAMERASRGAMGEVWRLATAEQTWAVKVLFDWAGTEGIEEELGFSARAERAGVVLPRPRRAIDGSVVVATSAGRVRVFEWVHLDHASGAPPDALGQTLALLHRVAPATDRPIDAWYREPVRPERWEAVIAEATARGSWWAERLRALTPSLVEMGELVASAPPGPAIICHRDIQPDNLVPDRMGRLVVLDWDNVGPDDPSRELGSAVLWFSQRGRDRSVAEVIYTAYREAGGFGVISGIATFAEFVAVFCNYLAVQAENALDRDVPVAQREFAEATLRRDLADPLSLAVVRDLSLLLTHL